MTIASELEKLNTNLINAYAACRAKGATIPADQTFDNLATCINSIPSRQVCLTVKIKKYQSDEYSTTTPYQFTINNEDYRSSFNNGVAEILVPINTDLNWRSAAGYDFGFGSYTPSSGTLNLSEDYELVIQEPHKGAWEIEE